VILQVSQKLSHTCALIRTVRHLAQEGNIFDTTRTTMKLVVSIYMGPEGSIFAEMSTALRHATWKTEICNIPVHLIMVGECLQRLGRIRTQRTLQYCHAYLLPLDLNSHTLHSDCKLNCSHREVIHAWYTAVGLVLQLLTQPVVLQATSERWNNTTHSLYWFTVPFRRNPFRRYRILRNHKVAPKNRSIEM